MGQKFQYVTVDTILAKYHRDFRGIDINESDAIEWIGESLGFMKIASAQEEAVAFIEVKDYQCALPTGLHFITQIARNNQDSICPSDIINDNPQTIINGGESENCLTPVDSQGNIIGDYQVAYYRPFFNLQYEYDPWNNSSIRIEKFTPVRLANHSFFNTLVCREENQDIYHSCTDEYTVAGNQLRFSFETGQIAISYLRQKIDQSTGYPMVPDDISCHTAINYYLGWKVQERMCYLHREGACQLSDRAERRWLKYIKQFKNKAKMPHGVDQYQNLMEQSRYLIPRLNRYYGFFGNLGRKEDRSFNNPR